MNIFANKIARRLFTLAAVICTIGTGLSVSAQTTEYSYVQYYSYILPITAIGWIELKKTGNHANS